MTPELIAPCGMNCGLCRAYQKEKGRCEGCRPGPNKRTRINCRIKTCAAKLESALPFCYTCGAFPCGRLKKLDARYRAKYHMSEISNLEYIRDNGLDEFLLCEEERWTCVKCGSTVCVHNPVCAHCGVPVPEYGGGEK
jgi:hypothetical protein